MIGIRHEKVADLKTVKFQLTHDLAVAHKYKNKMAFNELATNTTFSFDKTGVIKETKFYRFKYETDYKYAKLFVAKGKLLTISDIHSVDKPLSAEKRTDLIKKLNYLNSIFIKQDIAILKNSIEQFDNSEKLAKWYIQQSKNKKQSYKKTTGKSIHKSLKPFMRTIIFTGGKEDIEKINSISENDYNQTIISYMQKLQKKYNIQQDSIRITTHNDEFSRHSHILFHLWDDKEKKYLNHDMASPEVMKEHLNMLEDEFAKFELKKRTEYTKHNRKIHKTYAEHLTETEIKVNKANKNLAQLNNDYQSTTTNLTNVKEQINIIKSQQAEEIFNLSTIHQNTTSQLEQQNKVKLAELEQAKLLRTIENAKILNQVNLRYRHLELIAEELSKINTKKINSIIDIIETDHNIKIPPSKKILYQEQAKISKNQILDIFCELIDNFKQVFNKIQSIINIKSHNRAQIERNSPEIQ